MSNLCYKSTAMSLLGLTSCGFNKLNLTPAKIVKNPHYRSGTAYLYNEEELLAIKDSELVNSLKPKQRNKRDIAALFRKRYKFEASAIHAGCEALFNLNRYAKWHSCTKANREDIYGLKNRFIEMLYKKNYCQQAHIHTTFHEEYEVDCYCYMRWGRRCEKCNGTGLYVIPQCEDDYFVFHFLVNGQPYVWHQPKYLIDYEVQVSGIVGELNPTLAKPLNISSSKLSEAKALIRWILDAFEQSLPLTSTNPNLT